MIYAMELQAPQSYLEDGSAYSPIPASLRLLPSLHPDASHYRDRKPSVSRQATEPHLEDGGIYRKRWWAGLLNKDRFRICDSALNRFCSNYQFEVLRANLHRMCSKPEPTCGSGGAVKVSFFGRVLNPA